MVTEVPSAGFCRFPNQYGRDRRRSSSASTEWSAHPHPPEKGPDTPELGLARRSQTRAGRADGNGQKDLERQNREEQGYHHKERKDPKRSVAKKCGQKITANAGGGF